MSLLVSAFIAAALAEIRAVGAGDDPTPEDAALALVLFNELLDALNADRRAVFNEDLSTFTLTPALQPHTIGPSGATFTVTTNRPETIDAANIVITSPTPAVRIPLNLRDDEWWMTTRVQGVTSSIPTDLWYDPDWPNGNIYLWPVPSAAYGLELMRRTVLAQVTASTTLTLPPGYQMALRLTLAEICAPSFGVTVSPSTMRRARDARATVWSANDSIPRIQNDAAGLTGGMGSRGNWDYRTGGFR